VLLRQVRGVLERRLAMTRIRIHGDYHLGQVLYTGKDFVIVDFEGEPSRSLSERRFKRSPLRDVAGMVRSFEYAATYGLRYGPRRAEDVPTLLPWARIWSRWASAAFVRGYLQTMGDHTFFPRDPSELSPMLDFYMLDKTIYELRYELNNRPDWVGIPLEAILGRVEGEAARAVGAAR
jgi:maltose alpha-D-glucosyltransferase / alpha-amylase